MQWVFESVETVRARAYRKNHGKLLKCEGEVRLNSSAATPDSGENAGGAGTDEEGHRQSPELLNDKYFTGGDKMFQFR
ncbi:hypothetical protein EVAR_34129_1 [Eumeta japonica]|uniref:Uncharacterized protein n=1 Tax=Eumeta variegata TaxID=151549 RepID=A0A4C1WJZ5_EUMVA|nr:hypothetical protein EVAR_34129_1 [Eumeta japonica]